MTVPSANFQPILDAALDSYAKQTGIDLRKHPSADKLQSCATSEDVLQLLQDREIAFKDYRDKHRKLINCLRPVFQVVQAFSGVLGEVSGLVSPRDLVRLHMIYPHTSPITATRCHSNRQRQFLLASMSFSQCVSFYIFHLGYC